MKGVFVLHVNKTYVHLSDGEHNIHYIPGEIQEAVCCQLLLFSEPA